MLKKVLIRGGIILVSLFILASALMYFLFPKDVLIARILPELEARLGRPIELGSAGVSLWPPFGMYVEDLRVANLPPAITPTLLQIDYARGQLSLMALMKGRFVATAIELKGVHASYEVFADSATNISDLLGKDEGVAPFWVEQLDLIDASFVMRDARDQSMLEISKISASLKTDVHDMSGRLEISLGGVTWSVDTTRTHVDNPLTLEIHGTYNAESDRLSLRIHSGNVLMVPLEGSIDIDSLSSVPLLKSELTIGPVELSELKVGVAMFLTDSARQQLNSYECFGELRGHATYNGPAGEWSPDHFKAEAVWLDARLVWNNQELLKIASVTIPMDRVGYHVSCENAYFLGGPLQLAVVGNWPDENRIEVTVSGRADMERVGEWMQNSGLAGAIDYQATLRGRFDRPDGWSVRMRAEPDRVRIREPGMSDLTIHSGQLVYDGVGLTVKDVEVSAGSTMVVVEAQIPDLQWSSMFTEAVSAPIEAHIKLFSHYCNLDQFFPGTGAFAALPPDTQASSPLTDALLHIQMNFDTLIMGGVPWYSVSAELTSISRHVHIDTLSGRLFDGQVTLGGDIEIIDPENPAFDLTLQLDSMAMGELSGRFFTLGQHLKGRGSLEAKIESGRVPVRDMLDSLTVTGTVAFFDARLVDLQAAHGILKILGIDVADPIFLASRWNAYHLERGRVRLEDFKFRTSEADWTLNGSIGLDGSLNYDLAVTLSRRLSDRFVLPQSLRPRVPPEWVAMTSPADLVKNDNGLAELYLNVQGSYMRPSIKFDWERLRAGMQSRFESRVRDTIKDELKDRLKTGLKKLFNPKKP